MAQALVEIFIFMIFRSLLMMLKIRRLSTKSQKITGWQYYGRCPLNK